MRREGFLRESLPLVHNMLLLFPSGCLFHYARAVVRNIRRLGLHELVRDDGNAHRVARLCLAIPLAPPPRLQEALTAVLVEARRLNLADRFGGLFNYLRDTWVNGIGARLSVFGNAHRTNNVAETFNRGLNARLVRGPNIWRFIGKFLLCCSNLLVAEIVFPSSTCFWFLLAEVLREFEDVAWRDLARLALGQAPSRARRMSALMNDARVRSCSRQVMEQEMDMLHFLSSVSHHLENTLLDGIRYDDAENRPPSPPRSCPAVTDSMLQPSSPHQVRLQPCQNFNVKGL